MTSTPLVSIIIPTHNRPLLLVEALKSIQSQTLQNFEAIIINDAGMSAQDVVDSFKDPRFVYIEHETNKGLPAARNSGIRIAKGKYIAYLDDDDTFYPQHLEIIIYALQNSHFKVACSDTDFLCKRVENGQIQTLYKIPHHTPVYDPDSMVVENQLFYLSIAHEKACFEEVGYFDESLNWAEDWEMWIRLSRKFPFLQIPIVTTGYSYEIEGESKMTHAWIGKFLNALLILHKRYKDEIRTHAQLEHAQNFRNLIFAKAYQEIEQMDDEKLQLSHPEAVLRNIVDNHLLNTVEDIKAARVLSGVLLQRIQDNDILWRVYAHLCYLLGDLKSASIAITRAIEYKETEENIREYHRIFGTSDEKVSK